MSALRLHSCSLKSRPSLKSGPFRRLVEYPDLRSGDRIGDNGAAWAGPAPIIETPESRTCQSACAGSAPSGNQQAVRAAPVEALKSGAARQNEMNHLGGIKVPVWSPEMMSVECSH